MDKRTQLEEFRTFCLRILERPQGLTLHQTSALYAYLGDLQAALGEKEEAETARLTSRSLIEVEGDITGDVVSIYQRGRLLAQAGNLSMAERCFRTVLNDTTAPQRLRSRAESGLVAISEGEGERSKGDEPHPVSRTVCDDPHRSDHDAAGDVVSAYQYGSLLEQDGNLVPARQCFETVLKTAGITKRLRAGAYYHLATIALKDKDSTGAQEYLWTCLKEEPHHKRAKVLLYEHCGVAGFSHTGKNDIAGVLMEDAETMMVRGDVLPAAEKLKRLVALVPDHLEALLKLRALYNRQGNKEKTEEISRRIEALGCEEKRYMLC